jgi:dTDP-glucose 4,6-dehydratase
MDETHPVSAQSPYAATKTAADQLGLSYHRAFGVPVWIARPFNVFGPRQSARAVVPTIITQILYGKKRITLGNLDPTRDLTFVRDTVAGILAIADCDDLVGSATNIGVDSEISIGELAQAISGIIGSDIEIHSDSERVRPHGSEVERLRCDNRRILAHTEWRPAHTLIEGLEETVGFFRRELDRYKPDLYNR